MKKTVILISSLFFVACSSDNSPQKDSNSSSQQEIIKVKVKEKLFTEKGTEFLSFVLKDEFKTLSDGGEAEISESFPLYTAEKVTSDYDKNEIRANNLYKNKDFFITGKVGNIEAGLDDTPVITLKTNADYGLHSPLLKFNKLDQEKVAELDKGDKVTFLCTGKSEISGTPILENCLFLQTLQKQIADDVLNFEDKDLSGKNSQYEKGIYSYVLSTLLLSKISNDFEACTDLNTLCIEKILKKVSKEDIHKALDALKTQFPKAQKSIEKMK